MGFNIRLAVYTAEEMIGSAVPLTDADRPFFLGYHLKGVCNSNCGSRQAHRVFLVSKHGLLAAWNY